MEEEEKKVAVVNNDFFPLYFMKAIIKGICRVMVEREPHRIDGKPKFGLSKLFAIVDELGPGFTIQIFKVETREAHSESGLCKLVFDYWNARSPLYVKLGVNHSKPIRLPESSAVCH